MESLNDIQEDIKAKMLKSKSNFKKSPKERLTVCYIETRIENLEQQWQLFHTTHVKIISEIKKPDLISSNYYKNGLYDEVEEFFIQFKSELKEQLNNMKMSSETYNVSPGASCSIGVRNFKLPEVKIPVFSGNYSEWQTFRDLFMGLIHNNNTLDDAQKLYYLKGYLTGDAELLLRNINVTSDNYKASWAKLEAMYNNKRFIANGILKRLFNQKSLTVESAAEIKRLLSTTSDCLGSIKNLGVDVSSWDILIIYMVSAKLDKDTRKAWELKTASDSTDDLTTFTQFTEFLTGRFRGLENLENKAQVQKSSQSFHVVGKEKAELSCPFCSASHKVTACKGFSKESNDTRRDFVQKKGLCFICLGSNHSARFCRNTVKCHICKRRHHTLVHPSGGSGSVGEVTGVDQKEAASVAARNSTSMGESQKAAVQAEGSTKPIVSCLSTGNCKDTVLIPTALVKAMSKDGNYRVVRALVDQGSQGSFITESMAQYLGLKKTLTKHRVTGVGGNKTVMSNSSVVVNLRSRVNPDYNVQVNAYVLKSITSLLPVVTATRVEWVKLSETDLADPEYHRPNKIDILLGAEIFSQIIQDGIKKSTSGSLVAQQTEFGWILSGVVGTENLEDINSYPCITVMHSNVQTDDFLRKFWELEAEPSGTEKILSKEETECENIFTNTTKRDETGRYIVRLPFRDGNQSCKDGESRFIAEKRLKSLEFKLSKNDKLKADYTAVMQEYIELNHMVKVSPEEKNKGLYLPHHAVVREDKQTTKVRVVFDASCKGINGVSLNNDLMVGPTLQAELRHTVMRWRIHPICIGADIIKMYRQVLVNRDDTMFQRVLWRDSPEKEIEEFELVTVTFGTSSAPFLAVRSLHQVAYDEGKDYPLAAKNILNNFYMDDLMTGAESVDEGYKIHKEIKNILAKGGFQLQKWISNSEELLHKIRESKRDKAEEVKINLDKIDNITKILGLTWDPRADVFQYSVELPLPTEPVSKRKIISDISRLFDPLGWLSPSIILAKMLIQKLWLAGVGWDEEVPNSLLKEWITYRKDLSSLVNVKIPRWLNTKSSNVKTELHGFSDASKTAYAAVVYVRVIDAEGNIHVALVTSKTKVSPIKQVSIPRLELCGAVLLAKLMVDVAKTLDVNISDVHAWTDSEVVLAWLSGHPSRWKTFVANRVAEILTKLDTQYWSYVPSKQNPADCASRGVAPGELGNTAIWFNGPEFLRQSVIEYRKPKHLITKLEEVKVHSGILDISFWERFSSLSRMIRVVAYCRKFLLLRSNCANKERNKQLSTTELGEAMEICIRKGQEEGLQEEIEELKKTGSLGKKGRKYKSLNLFLDLKRVIRVGGRLEMSQLSYDRKHPILIPKDSFLTKLLISEAHQKTMHGGPQAMIAYLRSQYWVVGVKPLVKAFFRKCVTCIRFSNKTRSQLMGQLPSPRVTPNKAFLYSGVDYAGPINVRMSKGRGNKSYKGYIALFICLSTRAIHIEAVSDMTSKGFLAAFKRFVARRGHCAELHSDNGTNFVGAARELQELFNEEKSKFIPELVECLANNGTKWNFIPPHAPNFGGLWEAGIKSTKYHLRRVIGNSTLTFEELTTVLAQIEACLNSRPLSGVDENELTVLTPGHFLVGEPLVLVPDSNFERANISSLRRWQLTQRMLQDYWRQWSQDYLNQFLQRHKWAHQNPEPAVGGIVLIKEDDLPPGKWLLGKIELKHPGPDGITRVVTVRTKGSLIKRPITKLAILPVAS